LTARKIQLLTYLQNKRKKFQSVLAAFPKQYKGRCNKCGKWGHKGSNCCNNQDKTYPPPKHKIKNNSSENVNIHTMQIQDGEKKNTGTYFDGTCNYCKNGGHHISNCCKQQYNENKKSEAESLNVGRHTLPRIPLGKISTFLRTAWIGNSGALFHMVNSLQGVSNIETISFDICLGDGSIIKATKM
jgi:hypothetical protein